MAPVSHHFLLSHMAQVELLMIYRGDLNNSSNVARFSIIVVSQTELQVLKERALNTSSFKSHPCLLDTPQFCLRATSVGSLKEAFP